MRFAATCRICREGQPQLGSDHRDERDDEHRRKYEIEIGHPGIPIELCENYRFLAVAGPAWGLRRVLREARARSSRPRMYAFHALRHTANPATTQASFMTDILDPSGQASPAVLARTDMNLVWLDMEMTGLDPDNDRIIEIAVVVTNSTLDTLVEASVLAISCRTRKRSAEWTNGTATRTAAPG